MRKQTKLVAVLSAAALLAIGASMTSFAATGWTEEDGTWVYMDKDGYKVTNAWKKSGNFWYYLDEDGYMSTSKLLTNADDSGNIFYVDDTGRMVTNQWVELENEDYVDDGGNNESSTNWYYFQSSGKAYKTSGDTSFKTINNKRYAFDENGKMLYGWIGAQSERISGDDAYMSGIYYCGDPSDGVRVTSDWKKLYVGDTGPADSDEDSSWFYFQPNGKKYFAENVDSNGNLFAQKKINGKNYGFDETGRMVTDWYTASTDVASELYGYYSETAGGARQKGWFKVVPSKKINEGAYNDDSSKWFYGNNDGKLVVSQLKTISGKKYAFNSKGEMMNGVQALVLKDNAILDSLGINKESIVADNAKYKAQVEAKLEGQPNGAVVEVYYFGTGEDGSMKTGNQTLDIDGSSYQFAFGKNGVSKGKGLNGLENNKSAIYVYGKKVKAEADYRYQGADLEGNLLVGNSAIGHYLVNTSGAIMKGSKYTDSEGRTYILDNDKKVKEIQVKN